MNGKRTLQCVMGLVVVLFCLATPLGAEEWYPGRRDNSAWLAANDPDAFVRQCFQDYIGRDAQPEEIPLHADAIRLGYASPEEVRDGIAGSEAARRHRESQDGALPGGDSQPAPDTKDVSFDGLTGPATDPLAPGAPLGQYLASAWPPPQEESDDFTLLDSYWPPYDEIAAELLKASKEVHEALKDLAASPYRFDQSLLNRYHALLRDNRDKVGKSLFLMDPVGLNSIRPLAGINVAHVLAVLTAEQPSRIRDWSAQDYGKYDYWQVSMNHAVWSLQRALSQLSKHVAEPSIAITTLDGRLGKAVPGPRGAAYNLVLTLKWKGVFVSDDPSTPIPMTHPAGGPLTIQGKRVLGYYQGGVAPRDDGTWVFGHGPRRYHRLYEAIRRWASDPANQAQWGFLLEPFTL